MSNRFSLAILAVVALVAGCGAPMRYSQYTGRQTWTTGNGTMADKGYAIPVYRGWPDKPYKVIGSIQFSNPNDYWDDGDTARAARLGKGKKGDAIIMRYGAESGVGAIAGAAADAHLLSMNQVSVLVIRWKSQAELDEERTALQQFEAEFSGKHPDLNLRRDLVVVGADVIGMTGLTLETPAGRSRLDEILLQVLQPAKNDKSSNWLFKGTLRSSALTSSFTEAAYGVATLTQTGDSVTLVSAPGSATDINFSGTAKDGHLTGQLGVTSGNTIFSGKAEGVLVPEKLSLNGQAQTADGLVQSSFTFTR